MAFWDDVGQSLAGLGAGAGAGALIGTILLPGAGTVIGALVGGAAGAAKGGLDASRGSPITRTVQQAAVIGGGAGLLGTGGAELLGVGGLTSAPAAAPVAAGGASPSLSLAIPGITTPAGTAPLGPLSVASGGSSGLSLGQVASSVGTGTTPGVDGLGFIAALKSFGAAVTGTVKTTAELSAAAQAAVSPWRRAVNTIKEAVSGGGGGGTSVTVGGSSGGAPAAPGAAAPAAQLAALPVVLGVGALAGMALWLWRRHK